MLNRLANWLRTGASGRAAPRLAAATHCGLAREHNEDSFLCIHLPGASDAVLAIADGIGGHEGGEIASCMALNRLLDERLRHGPRAGVPDARAAKAMLRAGLQGANRRVQRINELLGPGVVMGTTVVAAVFVRSRVVVAHAGDSRCYRWRDQRLEQLTEDHTWVATMVRNGSLSREEASVHPWASLLSNCLGAKSELEISWQVCSSRPGDRFLLCSDGVSVHLSAGDIAQILGGADTPEDAVEQIIHGSLCGGGTDNISAGVAFV